MAATDQPHTHTLSKENAKALVVQPVEFGLDLIKLPIRMIQDPPHRKETSPHTLEPTSIDYRLYDVPGEAPAADPPAHGGDDHVHPANVGNNGHAPLKEAIRKRS